MKNITKRWEDRLADKPIQVPLGIAVAIGGAGVGLGIFTSLAALTFASLTLIALTSVASALLLQRRNQNLRRRLLGQKGILTRYAAKLVERQELDPSSYHYLRWSEEVTVTPKGGGHLTRTFDIKVGSIGALDAFWNISTCSTLGDDASAHQNAVNVEAKLVAPDGSGVNIDVSTQWEGLKLRTFVHFPRDIEPNAVISVSMTWDWPELFTELLKGEREDRFWKFRHAVDLFESKFVLAPEIAKRAAAAFPHPPGAQNPQRTVQPDGAVIYELRHQSVAVDTEFGYWIQLSK